MTVDNPLELVVSTFKSQAGAGLVLAALIDAGGEALQGVKDLATVKRGADARLHIQEANDMTAGRAAYGGGTAGLLIGILGGPIGMLIGGATGALIGALGGKLIDTGIPDARLQEIGAMLEPNSSAIVAFVAPAQVPQLTAALNQGGGTTLVQPVDADLPARLAALRTEAEQAAASAAPPTDASTISERDTTA